MFFIAVFALMIIVAVAIIFSPVVVWFFSLRLRNRIFIICLGVFFLISCLVLDFLTEIYAREIREFFIISS